jgi:two-component system cell cycle sensor histidine kinase/response regulator CckA
MTQALPRTVLVVEDQSSLRHLICHTLQRKGYRAMGTGRAARAWEIVKTQRGAIDLAIVDMVLPGMSGLDLAAWLARDFPAVSILYISGHVNSLAMQCIAQRSPNCVLLKPFTPSKLLARVDVMLGESAKKLPENARNSGERRSRSGTGD